MRLQDLLHHGSNLADDSCGWQRVEQKEGQPLYLLTQSRKGLAEEEANADVPAQTLSRWLRDMRAYSRLAPEKRGAFKTDFPFLNSYVKRGESPDDSSSGPLSEAVSTLTDADIDVLAKTGRVDVPGFLPSPQQTDAIIVTAKRSGFYNQSLNKPPTGAYLQLQPDTQPGRYNLTLGFALGSVSHLPAGFNFDTLDTGGEYEWILEMLDRMEQEEQAKPVELMDPQKRVPGKVPVVSLAAALDLWSKATGHPVFGEIFLKEKTALTLTSDKPETLLTRLCVKFGCDWRRIGGDYLVYSKSWAANRASDIPDTTLDRWRATIKKEKRLPLETLLEMSTLRDPQFTIIQHYLFVNVFTRPQNLHTLRLLQSLSNTRRERAMAKESVPLNTGELKVHNALAALFPKANDLGEASLRLEMATVHDLPAYTITVTLPSGESKYGFFTLEPPQPPMRKDQ